MDLTDPFLTATGDPPRDYRVQLLFAADVCRQGIEHRVADSMELLPWARIEFAIAAMVGEPEGVCTIIFELLIESSESELRVCRFDADPAEGAIPVSVALSDYLGRDRCGPSLLAMAQEGSTGLWYSDLESFEAAAAALLHKP